MANQQTAICIHYLSPLMLIEEKALKHWIDNFYGYGSWQARFWFVGYEEGGGEVPEEVADKLNYFHMMHPQTDDVLCDIRELYKHVNVRWEGPKANSFTTSMNTVSVKMPFNIVSGKISSRLYTATTTRNFLTFSHTSNTLLYRPQPTTRH